MAETLKEHCVKCKHFYSQLDNFCTKYFLNSPYDIFDVGETCVEYVTRTCSDCAYYWGGVCSEGEISVGLDAVKCDVFRPRVVSNRTCHYWKKQNRIKTNPSDDMTDHVLIEKDRVLAILLGSLSGNVDTDKPVTDVMSRVSALQTYTKDKAHCMGTTDKYYERGYKDAQAIEAKHFYDLAEYVHKLADSVDEERSK